MITLGRSDGDCLHHFTITNRQLVLYQRWFDFSKLDDRIEQFKSSAKYLIAIDVTKKQQEKFPNLKTFTEVVDWFHELYGDDIPGDHVY